MRILITTGIFEPEAGGPATYTPKIAEKLAGAGWDVTVATYSNKKKFDFDADYPFKLVRVLRSGSKLKNYWDFFRTIMRESRRVDLIYSLDSLAAGLPVTIVALIRRIPVVVRVGGDYLWERYLESGREPLPLTDFYRHGLQKDYPLFFNLIGFVLLSARHVIFNSDIQRDLYVLYWGLQAPKTSILHNPAPEKDWLGIRGESTEREIVFAGRFNVMKNVITLVKAFAKARLPSDYKLTLVGNGPQEGNIRALISALHLESRISILGAMHQKALNQRIKNCRAIVLPSWTDISPNQVSEALALGIPILVTKENYLSFHDQLPDMIDPRSVDDIASKLEMLADEERYEKFAADCKAIRLQHDWDDVLGQHLVLFESILNTSILSKKR